MKMPKFALKVKGVTVLRSDNAEQILQEMTSHFDSESRNTGDLPTKDEHSALSDIVYISGQIVDWIFQEIPTVLRAEMHLEGTERGVNKYDYPVKNVMIRIEGPDLSDIHSTIVQEITIREFMYYDVVFDIFEMIHNGTPNIAIQLIPKFRTPLTRQGHHTNRVPHEIKERISEELRKSSRHTYLKTVIQRLLSSRCKCESLRHGINLIELLLGHDTFSENELRAAEMSFEYLSDTREGQSLFLMWMNKEALRNRWNKRDTLCKNFISQVYEWFRELRTRECDTLSSASKLRLPTDWSISAEMEDGIKQ
ncbi:MAG: hypothetical protein P1Q69_02500 [Candidatus Thorarchaeota archaeon]|nr:hypothetical protein [Candidatus Thorarchaeota archaeon]